MNYYSNTTQSGTNPRFSKPQWSLLWSDKEVGLGFLFSFFFSMACQDCSLQIFIWSLPQRQFLKRLFVSHKRPDVKSTHLVCGVSSHLLKACVRHSLSPRPVEFFFCPTRRLEKQLSQRDKNILFTTGFRLRSCQTGWLSHTISKTKQNPPLKRQESWPFRRILLKLKSYWLRWFIQISFNLASGLVMKRRQC